ncbi:MAG: glycerophosphodiester phosphodiesterase family protein [Reyranella sp.]|uniref:glycerophosphodiester phosphodiesterase family protein n=1 Tax=Reyranella sp. TaxID=1929291 RepID=UPI003D1026E3
MTDIASHRGGALLWAENSRLAFEQTARLPVEQVEFDVHPSRDGRLVVIHDATLERTTDGTGAVCRHDWADLCRLTLKGSGGQRMLLLEEVIEIFRPTTINLRLEIKAGPERIPYPGHTARIVAALAAWGVLGRTALTSFQLGTVAEAPRHGTPMTHVWLVTPDLQTDIGLDAVIGLARAHGVPMLGLRGNKLDAATVARVREAGLGIGGWACNDMVLIGRMFDLGVDVFTTDRPDLAVARRAAS